LAWNIWNYENIIKTLAQSEAEANFMNDINYRNWASAQGGIYVSSQMTAPNPHLDTIPDRDIISNTGMKLTLVNPAYMIRMVHQMGNMKSENNTKITSLNATNPINNPDEWEKNALKTLSQTKKDYSEIVEMNGKEVYRYMAPFLVTNSCLKCHSAQGAKEGEVRGGISQIIPLDKYGFVKRNLMLTIIPLHILSLILGILLISGGRKKIQFYFNMHQLALKKSLANEVNLHIKNNELHHLNGSLQQLNEEYKQKNEELDHTRQALIQQHTRLRAITLLNQGIVKTQEEMQLWQTVTHILVRILKYKVACVYTITHDTVLPASITQSLKKNIDEKVLTNLFNASLHLYKTPNIQLNSTNEQLAAHDLNKILTIPILINNEIYSLIGIITQSDDTFKMIQDQIFLQRFAKQVTLGIQTILLHRSKQQSDELIRSQNQELEHLNSTKNKFFSILAHDLRSPIGTIVSMTGILKENSKRFDDEKKELFVTSINDAAIKTLQLTENLLEWGRLQQSEIAINRDVISLDEIIRNSISDVENNAKHKEITIAYQPNDNLSVYADPFMLRTVFRNLLSNSIKFTHIGGEIEIDVNEKEGYFYIAVNDNGVGMTLEQIKMLFILDQKSSTTGTAGESGSGLGLFLCRDLLLLQSGSFTITSYPQKGTTITVKLPCYTSKQNIPYKNGLTNCSLMPSET
jgi:signal transduction histidine kinase